MRISPRAFALLTIFAWTAFAAPARADLLFEGYSKVLLDGVHVGYFVQRYEFDPKKQEFATAYYLKTNPAAGNLSESLRARANAKFRPVSYQFTEVVGDHPRTIDASFKGEMMTAQVNDGGRRQVFTKKISKEVFLSSFLAYVMLAGKEGIKPGVNYHYQAIAEEDASVNSGNALISAEENVGGINAFKVLNTFKGSQFISYVTYKGESVATKSPVQKIATELVGSIKEATAGLSFNTNTVNTIFGSIPKGTENPVSRRAPVTETKAAAPSKDQVLQGAAAAPSEPADDAKRSGVPAGKGIMIKGSPSEN